MGNMAEELETQAFAGVERGEAKILTGIASAKPVPVDADPQLAGKVATPLVHLK
jgi:hypothetical protein